MLKAFFYQQIEQILDLICYVVLRSHHLPTKSQAICIGRKILYNPFIRIIVYLMFYTSSTISGGF